MPCRCGEVTCICFYVCTCRPQLCLCPECINMRDPQDLVVEKPSKQNQDESPRKKSAHSDPSNEQMYSLVRDSPPGQSRMEQSSASGFDPRKQTLGSVPEIKPSKSSPIDDPYPTIRKHLSQPPRSLNFDPHPILRKRLSETAQHPNFDPHAAFKRQLSQSAPPSNNDPHAILRRQLSQPAPPSNNDPSSILRRQLSQPVPPSNNDPRSILRRQLSQPAPPSNQDPHANLKRRLSEPRRVPIGGDLSSELPPSGFHKNPSIGGSSPSVSIKDPYLPSTSKTGGSETLPTSGFNNEFNSVNSTNSRGKNVSTHPSSGNSCADLEFVKKASDKASPSYESFSSRFSTLSCDENNNSGLTLPTFQNQDARQTSTDLSGQCSEIHTPLYLGTSGANSASCSNPESQFVHSSDRVPMRPSPQEHPLNLSFFSENEPKNSFSHSLEQFSRSPSPVPAKQQRMETTEFSNVPTGEGDNQSAEFFKESSGIFSTGQILPSSDSTAEGYFPETKSESAVCMSGRSIYTSCIVQNPSQYDVTTGQQEYPMDTDAFSSDSLSAPSTSGFFSPCPTSNSSQASSENMMYCNDLNDGRNFTLQRTSSDLQNTEFVQSSLSASSDSNRFSENPYFVHEVFTTSCQETASTNRESVITYQSSQPPPQSSSVFSHCQTTNPVNISHPTQASSSTFSPSLNTGDVDYLSSQTSNETTIPSQNTNFPHSNVNMVSTFSTATSTESTQSYARGQEHLSHHTQSSTLQKTSSEMHPSQRTARHRDDETGENN